MADAVSRILAAHDARNISTARAFKAIDVDGDGTLTRNDLGIMVSNLTAWQRCAVLQSSCFYLVLVATAR